MYLPLFASYPVLCSRLAPTIISEILLIQLHAIASDLDSVGSFMLVIMILSY